MLHVDKGLHRLLEHDLTTGQTRSVPHPPGAYADFATIGTTATLPWRIQSLYSNQAPPGQNGTDNTTQYNWIVVAPNNWDRNSTTGI